MSDALRNGVVIAISKSSQRMYVFRKGVLWEASPVSTGRKGKETPSGVFAILQKKEFHRSNLYSNAPMPFMQRLTWDGIAIHAGHLPGYPASHGCIRLPPAFAESLYQLTGYRSTAVIVVDAPLENPEAALRLARNTDAVIPIEAETLKWELVRLAAADPSAPSVPDVAPPPSPSASPAEVEGESIQLAAASSKADAQALWDRIARQSPELAKMHMSIVPAIVNGQQYYRLRATAPGAHVMCGTLKQAGIDCFAVI